MRNLLRKRRGVAALPMVLLIGGLLVEVVIVLTTSAYISSNAEFGMRLSSQALLTARSGMEDALIKVVRDKTFASTYTLTVDAGTASITVCKDSPAPTCAGSGKQQITVIGTVQGRSRTLQAVVDTDAATGLVTLEYMKEI
ncbi:MAG: hypothetical protein KGI60_02770 [Patescibacteria group bacterium]|nr:hypothetical protein [Patescibacteria group bacterium]